MEILFDNKVMSDPKRRRAKYGQLDNQISRQLERLRLAENLNLFCQDFKGTRCHEHSGDESGIFTVNLTGNQRLYFRPTEDLPPRKQDGGIDKSRVISITILGVFDPH
jgi:plasmid maintenance system killer protein